MVTSDRITYEMWASYCIFLPLICHGTFAKLRPFPTYLCGVKGVHLLRPFKPSYASHNLYIPLPLEIKVDWFDFFDEVLEQVRAGD